MEQLDINFEAEARQTESSRQEQQADRATLLNDSRAQVDTNFRILFEELGHAFITRSRKDIAIELKKIENRTVLLQDKINTLHSEVDRLSAIDLETEFKRMQGTIAQIAQAVNSIDTSLHHGINGVGAHVGDGLSYTNEAIRKYADDAAQQLARLDEETKTNIRFLEHKIQALADQNKQLRRGIRSGNIVQLTGLLLLLGAAAYIIAYMAGVRINMH